MQQPERTEIARHLHDTFGDNLAYLRLRLDRLVEQDEFEGSVKLKDELRSIRAVVDQVYDDLRGILDELRYGVSPDFSMSLRECIVLMESRAGFRVDYREEGKPRRIPDRIQRQVLYVIREILRNIEKHAFARQVALKLTWDDTGLTVESQDDGRGFDVAKAQVLEGHHGLKIMQEITDELNGHLQLVSSTEHGTHVIFWIPY